VPTEEEKVAFFLPQPHQVVGWGGDEGGSNRGGSRADRGEDGSFKREWLPFLGQATVPTAKRGGESGLQGEARKNRPKLDPPKSVIEGGYKEFVLERV